MCGLFGGFGNKERVIEALSQLQSRGSDSSGLASFNNGPKVYRKLKEGSTQTGYSKYHGPVDGPITLDEIEKINFGSLDTPIIGHTRWASESAVCLANTHPILSHKGTILLAHNGSLTDYNTIKDQLQEELGKSYEGRTDTEVLTDFIENVFDTNVGIVKGHCKKAIDDNFKGTYALLFLYDGCGSIFFLTKDSPLYYYEGEIGSDPNLFPAFYQIPNNSYGYLYTKDMSAPFLHHIVINDREIKAQHLYITNTNYKKSQASVTKGDKMLQEIIEQGDLSYNYLNYGKSFSENKFTIPILSLPVNIVGCGSSYNAGLLGKLYFDIAGWENISVNYSSESLIRSFSTKIAITQSGETADTLEVIRDWINRRNEVSCFNYLITNQEFCTGSQLLGKDGVYLLKANGPELAVGATKTFLSTCMILLALSDYKLYSDLDLEKFKGKIRGLIADRNHIFLVAEKFKNYKNALVMGSGLNYPMALEAALKLKEIAGIHAEAMPAEAVKHGPIAISGADLPCIFLLPSIHDPKYSRLLNNAKQMKARGSPILGVGTHQEDFFDWFIKTPDYNRLLHPLLNIVNMQLFSYFIGKLKKLNVDSPFACAKAITVY